jgi:hypothetical protein
VTHLYAAATTHVTADGKANVQLHILEADNATAAQDESRRLHLSFTQVDPSTVICREATLYPVAGRLNLYAVVMVSVQPPPISPEIVLELVEAVSVARAKQRAEEGFTRTRNRPPCVVRVLHLPRPKAHPLAPAVEAALNNPTVSAPFLSRALAVLCKVNGERVLPVSHDRTDTDAAVRLFAGLAMAEAAWGELVPAGRRDTAAE